MLTAYYAFGLSLCANIPIPGLITSSLKGEIDVRVWLKSVPDWLEEKLAAQQAIRYSSPYQDEHGKPTLRVWEIADGDYFHLAYADSTEFIVNRTGTEIWANWHDDLTLEDTSTYLLGPILGLVLTLRGVTCLHASAIAFDDKAIALLGPRSAGKSTTAAAFARLGYSVLTDDVVAIDDRGDSFLVQPGYPRLRLWPDSVNALFGAGDALPLLTPNWDKRYLDLSSREYKFQHKPLPLAAVYILGERADDPAAPFAEAVSANTGMMSLVANSYATYLKDKNMRAQEFDLLSRISARVPLRHVTPHADAAHLSRLCEIIIDDFQMVALSNQSMTEAK
jgi:hypothetical protein